MKAERYIRTKNDRYELMVEEGGGETFLHLDVYKWNKTTLLMLREELDQIIEECANKGKEVVSFYLPVSWSTKFHEMVKPTDFEVEFDDGVNDYIARGWFTKEI